MGVLADILANAKSFTASPGQSRRTVYDHLKYLVNNNLDFDYPASCTAANEGVQYNISFFRVS